MKVVSRFIRVLEIGLSLVVLIVVVLNAVAFIAHFHTWLFSTGGFQNFVDQTLLYVIGLEFVMMIIKRDSRLVIEILIFAIARKMVITMDNGADFLLGTIAIFILFGARYFFLSRTAARKSEGSG